MSEQAVQPLPPDFADLEAFTAQWCNSTMEAQYNILRKNGRTTHHLVKHGHHDSNPEISAVTNAEDCLEQCDYRRCSTPFERCNNSVDSIVKG